MPLKATNFAETSLQTAVQAADTVLVVPSADISRFPSLNPGDWFYLTLDDGVNREIVRCVAVTTNSFTVQRAQENTTARSWAAGTRIYCAITAATLADVIQQAQSGLTSPAVGSVRYNTTSGLMEYWSGSNWVSLNALDDGLNDLYWADSASDLPGGSGFVWPGLYRRQSANNWLFERRLNQGLAYRHLPAPADSAAADPWAPLVTFGSAASVTSITNSNLNIPSGKVLIVVGTDRDANPPSVSSINHPVLSNVTLQETFTSYAAGGRQGRVMVYEANSSGGTGNLVINFSGESWVTYVHVRTVAADKIGSYLGAVISNALTGVSNVSVSRTGGSPKVDLCVAHALFSNASPTWVVARDSSSLQTGAFSGWIGLASTSAAEAIDNVVQTFSVSPGNFSGVRAAVLQWAGPTSSSVNYTLTVDDLFSKLICKPGTTNLTLPVLDTPNSSDANGETGLEYFTLVEVPPNCTLNFIRGTGAQLWTGPNSGNVSAATVTSGASSRKIIGLSLRHSGLWQVISGAVD